MESRMQVRPQFKFACIVALLVLVVFYISGIFVIADGEHKDEGSTEQTIVVVETEAEQDDEKNAHVEKQVEDNNTENIIENVIEVEVSSNAESKSNVYIEEKPSEVFPNGEYQAAEKIWNMMKDFGWSDAVCAGIMGNLMAEVGGQTLNLNWQSYTGNELGICQWMGGRQSGIISRYGSNPSCEEQVQYMYDELMGTNGVHRQVSEYQYQLIINSSTPEEAAKMFAMYFERCANYTYSVRQKNAAVAYNYFVNR